MDEGKEGREGKGEKKEAMTQIMQCCELNEPPILV